MGIGIMGLLNSLIADNKLGPVENKQVIAVGKDLDLGQSLLYTKRSISSASSEQLKDKDKSFEK